MPLYQRSRKAVISLEHQRLRPAPCHNYYGEDEILILEPCDDTGDWTAATGTIVYDTDNVRTCGTNRRSLKIVSAVDGQAAEIRQTLAAAVDCTSGVFDIQFYVHPGSGLADPDDETNGLSYIEILLHDSTLGAYYKYRIWKMEDLAPEYDTRAGWWRLTFPLQLDDGHAWVATGGPDITDIQTVTIQTVCSSVEAQVAVTIDRWGVWSSPFANGYWTLRCDGTKKETLDIAGYLQSKGARGNFSINIANVGDPTYLTVADIRSMAQAGHEIGCYLPAGQSKTQAEKIEFCQDFIQWIYDENIPQGSNGMILTHGAPAGYCPWDHETLIPQYAALSISLRQIPYGGNFLQACLPSDTHYQTVCPAMDGTPPANLADLITEAETMNLVLAMGVSGNDAPRLAAAKTVIDDLVASNLVNATMREVVEGKLA